jgi:nucleotide-binding universal stress UspA family protein
VAVAEERNASLIVLGPHRRSGLLGHLQGSVAAAVIAHSTIPVMAIPERSTPVEATASMAPARDRLSR